MILLMLVCCSSGGIDPLFEAVKNGDVQQVKLLLEGKSNVNAGDRLGETPLQCAIRNNQTEVADFLKKRGGK